MKNLKISVCFFLTAGFLLTAGTAAYLSASDQKVNTLAVGHVTTEIEENFCSGKIYNCLICLSIVP